MCLVVIGITLTHKYPKVAQKGRQRFLGCKPLIVANEIQVIPPRDSKENQDTRGLGVRLL